MIGQTYWQESNKQFGKDQSYLCANRLSETHQNYAFGIFSDAILSKTTQLQTQKIQVRWKQVYKKPLSHLKLHMTVNQTVNQPGWLLRLPCQGQKNLSETRGGNRTIYGCFFFRHFYPADPVSQLLWAAEGVAEGAAKSCWEKRMQPSCTHILWSRYGTIGPSTHGAFPLHSRCTARPWLNSFSLIQLAWNPWPSRYYKWYLVTGTTTSWKTFQTNQSRQGARRSSIGLQMCGAVISSC